MRHEISDSLNTAAAADHLIHGGVTVQTNRAVVLGSLHLSEAI